MGVLADLATHYTYWRLNSFTLKYTPDVQLVTSSAGFTNAIGVLMIAYGSDPDRVPATPPSTGQIIDAKDMVEFNLNRPFTFTFRPRQLMPWLETSHGTQSSSTTLRGDTAGYLTFVSSFSSSAVSGTAGRLLGFYDVSLKGHDPLAQPPTYEIDRLPSQLAAPGDSKRVTESKSYEPSADELKGLAETSRLSTTELEELEQLRKYKKVLLRESATVGTEPFSGLGAGLQAQAKKTSSSKGAGRELG